MRRLMSLSVVLFILAILTPLAGARAAQSELPQGVPTGAVKATVVSVVDGDTIKVSLNKKGTVIELAGLDAPEKGECFATDSLERLQSIVPKPTTVYIEESGIPNGNGLTSFVWIPGKDGGKASLLNTKLVREGYAGYLGDPQMSRYGDRLSGYELDAKEAGKGVWGACDALHQVLPPPPTPTPIPSPTPTPEPEPQGLTQQERAYIEGSTTITDYLSPAFTRIGTLMFEASDNPFLLIDQDWLFETAVYLVIIQGAYDDGLALNPPDSLVPVHELFLEGLRLYNVSVDVIATAIDNLDPDGMNYAASLVTQGSDYINLATEALNTFLESRGL